MKQIWTILSLGILGALLSAVIGLQAAHAQMSFEPTQRQVPGIELANLDPGSGQYLTVLYVKGQASSFDAGTSGGNALRYAKNIYIREVAHVAGTFDLKSERVDLPSVTLKFSPYFVVFVFHVQPNFIWQNLKDGVIPPYTARWTPRPGSDELKHRQVVAYSASEIDLRRESERQGQAGKIQIALP